MKILIASLFRTIFNSIVTRPMIFWGAKLAARQSDTLIDDKSIVFLEKAFDGDIKETRDALKSALERIEKEYKAP